jgi:hypothetical protein
MSTLRQDTGASGLETGVTELKIIVCGEALMDVFATGETASGMALDAQIGGSPLNVAIGLARLSQSVSFFGALSRGPMGERLLQALHDEGVDTTPTLHIDAPTTLRPVSELLSVLVGPRNNVNGTNSDSNSICIVFTNKYILWNIYTLIYPDTFSHIVWNILVLSAYNTHTYTVVYVNS